MPCRAMPAAEQQEAAIAESAAAKAKAKAKAAAAAKAKAKALAKAAAGPPGRRPKSVLRAAAKAAAKKNRRQANKYGAAITVANIEKGIMYGLKEEYEMIVDEVHRDWPDAPEEILDGDEFGPMYDLDDGAS